MSYYIIPDIEAFPSAKGEEKIRLARRIALAVGDPVALRRIIGSIPDEFASFYPDMTAPELSTEQTIDTFIDNFADPATPRPDSLEELLPAAGTPVYNIADLEALPEIEPLSPTELDAAQPEEGASSMLDAFLAANPPKQPRLSESLAKVMIKNGNYQKALEIITELSLNNPKKSVYFADQMRFLHKLIAIQQKTR